MPKPGDTVKIRTSNQTEEGILMPSFREDVILIKLPNGYNMGFTKSEVQEITVIKEATHSENEKTALQNDESLPTIAILHTGGTIASRVDYKTGGVYASFTVEDFLIMFPEMKSIANIRSNHVSNMMSEDMRFYHYQKIAEQVKAEVEAGVDGIIIGHGTDTLAITAAALSFMFEDLPIPVILVGSQRSSDRGSSDAAMNMVCAAEFITKTDFAGVAICMHESSSDSTCLVMPPTKTRKLHTSRRDAFKIVNDTPIARVNYATRDVEFLREKYSKREDVQNELILKDSFEDNVAIIRTHPNMSPLFIDAMRKKKYKGMVFEVTGIGQAPTNIEENLPIYEALKQFIAQDGVIVLTSQCLFGRVHPDIYTNCRRLKDIGIIFGEDMLTETAHVKLAWLLGNYSVEETKQFLNQNLRGEINETIKYDDEFLQ